MKQIETIDGKTITLGRCRGIYGPVEAWESKHSTWVVRGWEKDRWVDTGLHLYDETPMKAFIEGAKALGIELEE